MFSVERRYLVKLTATGTPGSIVDVPWISEEPVQYLAVNVFTAGQQDLPVGSVGLVRNGQVLTPVVFAGKTIIVPAYSLDLGGSDYELGFVHPSNGNKRHLDGIVTSTGTPGTSTITAAPREQNAPALFTTVARITNGGATPIQLLVQWTALAWRNA